MAKFKTTLLNGKTVFFEATDRDLSWFVELTDAEEEEVLSNWYDDAVETCSEAEYAAAREASKNR